MTISRAQRQYVWSRAGNCCEYCRLPSSGGTVVFHVDHIIATKHGGSDTLENLCLACFKCNAHKNQNVAGFDPETRELTRLYNPREENWDDHFVIQVHMSIEGLTPEGRTTVNVLQMNDVNRIETRQILFEIGEYPCVFPE